MLVQFCRLICIKDKYVRNLRGSNWNFGGFLRFVNKNSIRGQKWPQLWDIVNCGKYRYPPSDILCSLILKLD